MHIFRRGIFKFAVADMIESFVDHDIELEEIIQRNHGIELRDSSQAWLETSTQQILLSTEAMVKQQVPPSPPSPENNYPYR